MKILNRAPTICLTCAWLLSINLFCFFTKKQVSFVAHYIDGMKKQKNLNFLSKTKKECVSRSQYLT